MSATSILLGLIGSDLSLSRTPALHEAEGLAQGRPTVYRRIDTLAAARGKTLPDLLSFAIALGFDGLNITHPFKQQVGQYLDDLDPTAAAIGAVNTVVIDQGRTTGYNTDVTGYERGLRAGLPGARLSTVVQVGAGGAGGAVAHALARVGAGQLIVADIDPARAHDLAAAVNTAQGKQSARGIAVGDLPEVIPSADGVVNATPLGMLSHPGTSIDPALLHSEQWVSDVVYMPLATELLRAARARGCRTLDGTQ